MKPIARKQTVSLFLNTLEVPEVLEKKKVMEALGCQLRLVLFKGWATGEGDATRELDKGVIAHRFYRKRFVAHLDGEFEMLTPCSNGDGKVPQWKLNFFAPSDMAFSIS